MPGDNFGLKIGSEGEGEFKRLPLISTNPSKFLGSETPLGLFLALWSCHKKWRGLEKVRWAWTIDEVIPL